MRGVGNHGEELDVPEDNSSFEAAADRKGDGSIAGFHSFIESY